MVPLLLLGSINQSIVANVANAHQFQLFRDELRKKPE